MKRISLLIFGLTLAANAFAQGTLTFNNRIVGVVDVKINNEFGVPADGSGYSVQLYAAQAPSQFVTASLGSLTAILGTVNSVANQPIVSTFRTGAAAGYFNTLGDVALNGIAGGAYASLQLRAWNNATGSSWETATVRGESNLFNTEAALGGVGSPPSVAASLVGLQPFSMAVVPEPSTVVLGVMGGLALLLRRRK